MNRYLTSIVLALVVAAFAFADETKSKTKPVVSQDVLSAPVLPKGIVKTADGVECENRFMMHEWMLTLLASGKPVLTVDLRGYGETQQLNQPYFSNAHFGQDGCDCYFAFNLNKTYVGFRAEDLYSLNRFLRKELKATGVECIAVNEASIPALHAEFCEPETFDRLTVVNTLASWTNMVENGGYSTTPFASVVHGALQVYDLPELRTALEKAGKLTVSGLRWEKEPKERL